MLREVRATAMGREKAEPHRRYCRNYYLARQSFQKVLEKMTGAHAGFEGRVPKNDAPANAG